MVSLVVIYVLVLVFNKSLMHCVKWILEVNFNCCKVNSYGNRFHLKNKRLSLFYSTANVFFLSIDMPTSFVESNLKRAISFQTEDLRKMANLDEKPKFLHGNLSKSSLNNKPIFMIYADQSQSIARKGGSGQKEDKSLWIFPIGSRLETMCWIFKFPIKLLLTLTIPNPKTYRRCYPFTFIMCIILIGLNSWCIIWMLTVMGKHIVS